jgi:hypothetical protein
MVQTPVANVDTKAARTIVLAEQKTGLLGTMSNYEDTCFY